MKDESKRAPRIKPHDEEEEFDFKAYQLEREIEEAEEAERQRLLDEEEDARFEAELNFDPGELSEEELAELGLPQGETNAQTKGKQE